VTAPTCAHCGAAPRRWPAVTLLPLVPVIVGVAAAIFVSATKGRLAGGVVAAAVTIGFGVLLAALVLFARSVLAGRTCASCGNRAQ
jgi:hypothetical protein